jgi:hypothetical protein
MVLPPVVGWLDVMPDSADRAVFMIKIDQHVTRDLGLAEVEIHLIVFTKLPW